MAFSARLQKALSDFLKKDQSTASPSEIYEALIDLYKRLGPAMFDQNNPADRLAAGFIAHDAIHT